MTGPWGAPDFAVLEEKAINGMQGRQCLEEKKQGPAVSQNQGAEFQEGKVIDYQKEMSRKMRAQKKCTDFILISNL